MADFRDYFNNRISQELARQAQSGVSTKFQELQQASAEKLRSLAQLHKEALLERQMQENSLSGKLGLDSGGLTASILNTGVATANEIVNFGPKLIGEIIDQNANTYPEWDSRHAELKAKAKAFKEALNFSDAVGINPDTHERASGLGQRILVDGALSLANSAISVPETVVGLASLVSGGHAGKVLQEAGFRPQEAKEFINGLKSAELRLANASVQEKEGFWNTISAMADNPSTVPEALLESLFPMLAGGVAARGLMALGVASKGLAAASGEGLMMAGSQAENIRNQTADKLLTLEQSGLAAATGVMGAAVSRLGAKVANKVGIGDIDEAVVAGTLGKSPRGAVTRTVGGGLLESGEEATQSAGETIALNIALDRPWDKDLGNNMAMGAVTGFAMGAPMGLAETVADKKKANQQQAAKINEFLKAAATGDISAYIDPTKASYDPSTAIAVLMRHSQQEGTTEETKQENLTKANDILTKLEEQRQKVQDQYDAVSPETLAQNKEHLAQVQEELTKVDPADTEAVASLKETQDLLVQQIADIEGDTKSAERLKAKLDGLDNQINQASGVRDQFSKLLEPKITDEELNNVVAIADSAVDLADTKAVEDARSAAKQVINLSMSNPEQVTAEIAAQLASNQSNGLTAEQRSYLRTLSEAKMAENELKSIGKVADEVLYGSDKYIGIAQYIKRMSSAVAGNNAKAADRLLGLLDQFAADHAQKYEVAKQAMEQGKGTQIIKTENGWEIATRRYSNQEMRANGGLTLNSEKLVEVIGKEANALAKTQASLKFMNDLKFGQTKTPVSPSPTPTTPPVSPVASSTASATTAQATPSPVAASVSAAPNLTTPTTGGVDSASLTGSPQNNVSTKTVEDSARPETSSEPPPVTETSTTTQNTQTESVSEAVDSTTDVAEDGKLTAFQNKSAEGTPFKQRNLIADYFTQKSEGQRPLTSVKDFATKLKNRTVSAVQYLKSGELTDKQFVAVEKFTQKALEWKDSIKKNLVKGNRRKNDPNYYYNDLMQFFINENTDIDENLKTALTYAGFSYIADNASKVFNTPTEINNILGRESDAYVSPDLYRELGLVGARQNLVINGLGQRAVQALGLKVSKDAPRDLMPKLESALGAHVLKLLLDRGIMQRTTISGEKMAALTDDPNTNKNASFQFIRLARDAQYNLHPEAQEIADSLKGSQSVLDKLLNVEPSQSAPSFTPVPFTQKTTKNTRQRVPEKLAKIIEAENKVPNYLRQDMWQLISQLDEDIALAIAGVVPVSDETTHEANRFSIEAKNEGLRREYYNLMDFVGNDLANSEEAFDTPMYFEHSVWKQQRVGISNNVINPQTSKIHRFMLYRKAWETKVDKNDPKQMENFRLRVLEGLGVKTDKQSNNKSLSVYEKTVNTPEIQKAVEALRKVIFEGGDITREDQSAIAAAVKIGGEKFHSLDALVALATEANAKDQDNFTVYMMGEVDGVTNGPMLSHLLLGAAATAKNLFSILNRGGFFEVGNQHNQYNIWREQPGHMDLYEATAKNLTDVIKVMVRFGLKPKKGQRGLALTGEQIARLTGAIYSFTGELTDKDGKVSKAGRNIVKTPLTSMIFGASINKTVDNMATKFIEAIYAKIEDVAKGKEDLANVVSNLQTLGLRIPSNISTEQLMKEFTPSQVTTLKTAFKDTIGNAIKSTMETDFNDFIETRRQVNDAAQLSFDLYNAVFTGLKSGYIAELVANKQIEVNQKGAPIHGLSVAQEMELQKRIAKMTPIMQTLMSKESKDLGAGILAAKTERTLSTDSTYGSEVQFASAFNDNNAFSVSPHGFEVVNASPGVAMAIMAVHSTDSAISHMAANGHEVLNIHDAHGSGLGTFDQTAQNLNKATWYSMLNYSPATEVGNMLGRTIVGLASILQDSNTPQAVKDNIGKVLASYAEKHEITSQEALWGALQEIRQTAYLADKIKFEALSNMASVDQYALEGGNYTVTEEDRAAAQAKLNELSYEVATRESEAVAVIYQALGQEALQPKQERPTQQTTTNAFGATGKPDITSEQDLVALFQATGSITAADAIQVLAQKLSQNKSNLEAFNLRLLKMIQKVVSPDLKITMVTTDTKVDEVLEPPTSNSRAWYVSKYGKKEIYVLSPEFVDSGLTAETLLHELVHAAIASVIANPSKEAAELVAELNTLLDKAKEYVADNNLTKFNAAIENVQELVAWGMTNLEFQLDVLNKISMESKTKRNALVNGMKAFINILTGLLFRSSTKSEQEKATNGMSVLISNVSGLFYEADKTQQNQSLNLSMANAVASLTTQDILQALSDGTLQPSFETHLQEVLGGIVEKLHGPFGSFKDLIEQNQPKTPEEAYAQAMQTGNAPFASEALVAGFRISDQEAYAIEQVEATVRAALEGNEGQTSVAYTELSRLYTEAYNRLKNQTFTPDEQALFDFVFKIESGADKRSNYLSRFAALGLAHQDFNKMLQMNTAIDTRTVGSQPTMEEKVQFVFNKMLNFLNGKLTHTFDGQRADFKLTSLVEQLVGIETKKRRTIEANLTRNSILDSMEEGAKDFATGVRNKLGDWGQKDFFQKSNKQWLRMVGNITTVVGKDRVDVLLDAMMQYRDRFFKERQGIVASIVSDVRGLPVQFQAMLRATKNNEKNRKFVITQTAKVVLESFVNKGKDLAAKDKQAISDVFLRTDMAALLDSYSLADLQNLITDSKALNQEISKIEAQLAPFGNYQNYFKNASKYLAFFMATGEVRTQHLMMNAGNIARMYGTPYFGRLSDTQIAAATPIIDQLVSLYALKYTEGGMKIAAARVFEKELQRTDGGNGVDMVLQMHRKLQQESKDRLFKESEALMMKGYTPEIYNPNVDVRVVEDTSGADLVAKGYVRVGPVEIDPKDYNKNPRSLYVMRDGGLNPRLSGVFSLTSMQSKGTEEFLPNSVNFQTKFQAVRDAAVTAMFRNQVMDPELDKSIYAAPVVNAMGKVTSYRYLMRSSVKNNVLERDNRFEKVLGTMMGSIVDKETSAEQNARAVQALKDFYDQDYAAHPHSYVEISPNSSDPEIREIYNLLPTATKQAVKKVWGNSSMMVRYDSLDINFGYRKLSLANVFDKPNPNAAEHAFIWFMERALETYAGVENKRRAYLGRSLLDVSTYGQRAQMVVRRNERIWQEIVHEMKDLIVIKTGTVLFGNIMSNVSLLMMNGVPFMDIVKHHRVAMKAAMAYQKDSSELFQLKAKLDAGQTNGNDDEIRRQISRLEDHIARNPVRDLIEAGLMPTIVEDIAADDDIYSYKSKFARDMDKYASKMNSKVVAGAKVLYMAHDTRMYKALSHVTQLSDFVARYTLYQHLLSKKVPLTKEQAIQESSDAFVNYDIPMHRQIQYMDDMGLMMFTKYFMRIQRVLMKLTREHPTRMVGMILMNNYFNLMPLVTDSSVWQHLGNNPFNTGAFQFPSTLDELATVHAGLQLFK